MIDQIDLLLRQLFLTQIAQLADESQIGFEPPNDEWRQRVVNLTVNGEPANSLNVYLVDIREKRDLRSNAVERQVDNGLVSERRSPPRIDLHYAVSAWTPQQVSASVEPTLVEHELLGQAISTLVNNDPLVAQTVYAPTPPPVGFPADIVELPLTLVILPIAGFDKIADFWSAMEWHWKPVVHFILTTPILLDDRIAGHMVTTRTTRAFTNVPAEPGEAFDTMTQILGHVLDAANPQPDGTPTPIANALVIIGTFAGVTYHRTTSDALGRFTFGRLQSGSYQLRASVVGRGEVVRSVDVPSQEYDLTFA